MLNLSRENEFYLHENKNIFWKLPMKEMGLTKLYSFIWKPRGFIKVLNRRATEFDTRAKRGGGGSGGMLPLKILKFYSRRDVFSCILKLQTMTLTNQKEITFLDSLIMIWYQYPPHKFIGLFGSLLIAPLIIIFTQTHCQHLSCNQSQGQSLHLEGPIVL